MEKKQVLLKLGILFLIVFTNSHLIDAQVVDASSALKDLSGINVEKQKMFPIDEVKVLPTNDSIVVQPPSKVSTDNPDAYQYRLDPVQIKSIFPEIVYKQNDNLIIDYYSLFPILFEMINNQQNQIEELKNQIEELKKLHQ